MDKFYNDIGILTYDSYVNYHVIEQLYVNLFILLNSSLIMVFPNKILELKTFFIII